MTQYFSCAVFSYLQINLTWKGNLFKHFTWKILFNSLRNCNNFILFELDFDEKIFFLCLLQFLSDLKSTNTMLRNISSIWIWTRAEHNQWNTLLNLYLSSKSLTEINLHYFQNSLDTFFVKQNVDLDYFVSLKLFQFLPKLKEIISQITISKFLHIQTDLNGYNVLKLGFERVFLRIVKLN